MILALNNGIFSHKGPGLDWSELCHSFCEADTEAIPFFFRLEKADFNENTTGTKSSFQKRSFVTGTCSATEIRFYVFIGN